MWSNTIGRPALHRSSDHGTTSVTEIHRATGATPSTAHEWVNRMRPRSGENSVSVLRSSPKV